MRWMRASDLADKLSISPRTVTDWCVRGTLKAKKKGHFWFIELPEDLLIELQAEETKWIPAVELARLANIPRRTVSHWCKVRPNFAFRIGKNWYVSVSQLQRDHGN